MIEQQVQDTTARLKHEMELEHLKKQRNERHAKLDDLRKDYDLKMQIINEINNEKEIRRKYEENMKKINH